MSSLSSPLSHVCLVPALAENKITKKQNIIMMDSVMIAVVLSLTEAQATTYILYQDSFAGHARGQEALPCQKDF